MHCHICRLKIPFLEISEGNLRGCFKCNKFVCISCRIEEGISKALCNKCKPQEFKCKRTGCSRPAILDLCEEHTISEAKAFSKQPQEHPSPSFVLFLKVIDQANSVIDEMKTKGVTNERAKSLQKIICGTA